MNKTPHPSTEQLVPITLKINEHDIAEMEYHLNECPMSNPAQDNAITFALQRQAKRGLHVAVHIATNNAQAEIGPWTCQLGSDVGLWLGKVLTGCRVRPAKFRVLVPMSALRKSRQPKIVRKTQFEREPGKLAALSA